MPEHDGLLSLHELVGEDVLPSGAFEGLHDDPPDDPFLPFERGPELPRIRPILVVLAARASGQDSDADLQRAAELLHKALAVHDVALGREGGRRRRVARRVLKRGVTWLGGNHLTLRAIELAQAARPDVLGDLLSTVREFADGHELMAELQEGRPPTREDWMEHADRHTGALFAFCCKVGAKTSANPRISEDLARYGRHLGRLWHIAEDVAVLQQVELQQALVARALAGRPMLPVACAIERTPSVGRLWTQLVSHPSDGAASWLAGLVAESGGLTAARERMLQESWNARQALHSVPESHYRTALERLVGSVAVASIRTR
ncbi:MAG: polyprenyl synthetase family protein [Myxococcales bacterium]|nr:polyprenyl synthetase family protein [Myxococcales bacterium]MCB9668167.1 polyprenyl synthetase family protein [Alphaproteobacteria bacterium]MCB9692506.1 polyprenyl synthetase family protein [Alphaproteobacteria bacterium]